MGRSLNIKAINAKRIDANTIYFSLYDITNKFIYLGKLVYNGSDRFTYTEEIMKNYCQDAGCVISQTLWVNGIEATTDTEVL